MTSIKRVTNTSGGVGGYSIIADPVYIYGNLYVTGNTNTTSTNDLAITNNSIILNAGLSGANAPNPQGANITVDRGTSPNVTIQWSETLGYWQLTNDGTTYGKISTTSGGSTPAAGYNASVQFNSANLLAASNSFTFGSGNLSVFGTNIGNGNVYATGTGQDLSFFAPNGTVYVNSTLKLSYQNTAPTNIASTTQIFANTVGSGNTGLFVVNSNTTDELISKNRAIGMSLLLSY